MLSIALRGNGTQPNECARRHRNQVETIHEITLSDKCGPDEHGRITFRLARLMGANRLMMLCVMSPSPSFEKHAIAQVCISDLALEHH
jgi:hypothetical protein